MKKLFKITKWILLSLLALVVLVIAGLLIYYHSIYTETPYPTEITAKTSICPVSTGSDLPILFPIPKKVEWTSGYFNIPATPTFSATPDDAATIKNCFSTCFNTEAIANTSGVFKCVRNKDLDLQGYRLVVNPGQIVVEYSDFQGLFYALTTVKQMAKQTSNKVPCVKIEDAPDMKTRGAMLDISRGKVPTLETLYGMVDFISSLKYNHLELYIEGFSFAYPSFTNLWEKTETPITPEEIRKLDAYCKGRYIDLVPNQNSLGHMAAWLATDEYKDLAECPDGYKFLGLIDMKTTLSPTNPKSLELVTKMADDLLPNFTSEKFNINLDEPFELGKNKDRPITDKKEIAKIYLDYAKKLNEYVKSKGKKMMIWGDVVSMNPEFIAEIPKDITLLEWRYESFQDFENICKKYQEAGLHFMVCPGTSSWTSFTGRTDNMMGNVENAVGNGIKYGADGMLITDWGDTPHLQYLTVSYAGLAYGAALSWNFGSKSHLDLSSYLGKVAFNDKAGKMGQIVLDLGRYNQFEEYPMVAGTMTAWAYRFGMMEKTMTDAIFKKVQKEIAGLMTTENDAKQALVERFNNPKTYNYQSIIEFTDALEQELLQTKLSTPDSSLIIDEYKNAIRMIKLGAKLKQYNNYRFQQTDEQNKQLLTGMNALCTIIITEHERLWMQRNKRSGLVQSTEAFVSLRTKINEDLDSMNKNFFSKWIDRTIEKLTTAAGALYLK